MSQPHGFADKVAYVWKVADRLRGTFEQHEYGSVMLPLLVLRRLDAVLEPTKDAVVRQVTALGDKQIGPGEDFLLRNLTGVPFYNASPLSFRTLLADDKNVAASLHAYVNGLSPSAAEIIERYDFAPKVTRMDAAGILYPVLSDFADLRIGPGEVSNEAMGHIFEELLRKFSEMSNETAGEHYTPREVIRLVVDLLLSGQAAQGIETSEIPVRTVYDPAAGTGGLRSPVKMNGVTFRTCFFAPANTLTPELVHEDRLPHLVAARHGENAKMFDLFFNDPWFRRMFVEFLGESAYKEFRGEQVV